MKISVSVLFLMLFASACVQQPQLPVIDHIALEKSTLKVEVLAKNLDVPWDIDYADDGYLWVAEQGGNVSRIDLQTGIRKQMLAIKEVWRKRTAGLLGMVVHPDFKNKPYVFVNYTLKKDSLIFNHLVRYEFKQDTLVNAKLLLKVNGFTAHNGSRLAIGADGKLLWATGDAYNGENAQNLNSLNGKILRLNIDGTIPADNPYPNSYVWARGFRN
ncbi:MAG: PQQ-dependent sugar dehydrogenase, partial [Bacteroidia bacterium]